MKPFYNTVILIGVFAALLAVFVFYASDGAEKRRNLAVEEKPVFTASEISTLTQVIFVKSGQPSTTLMKDPENPDKWLLGDKPVNSDEAMLLVSALQDLPQGKIVSKNSQSWEGYGLLEESASQVVLTQGNLVLATLFLGNPGPSYPSSYLRRDDQDLVYLVKTSLQQLVDYGADRWTVPDKVVEAVEDTLENQTEIEAEKEEIPVESSENSGVL